MNRLKDDSDLLFNISFESFRQEQQVEKGTRHKINVFSTLIVYLNIEDASLYSLILCGNSRFPANLLK